MASDDNTIDAQRLLQAIDDAQAQNEDDLLLVMTALNQGIAKLSVQNSRSLTSIEGRLIKSIDQYAVDNSNAIDQLGMAILGPINDWQDENLLLLTQLAAQAGLTQPGDPLEAALLQSVADEPQLAYSATLLIALRDALPFLGQLIEVLREIRDRMPVFPATAPGEIPSIAGAEQLPGEPLPFPWEAAPKGGG